MKWDITMWISATCDCGWKMWDLPIPASHPRSHRPLIRLVKAVLIVHKLFGARHTAYIWSGGQQ